MEEREAIQRMRRGEIGGLEEIVRRYQIPALRTAYLVTRDLQLAEDVVQAGFLQAYERIGQFDLARPFGPWFMRSLVNAAIKAAVRAERSVSLDDEPNSLDALTGSDSRTKPEVALELAETRRAVLEALAFISPKQRAVVVLRYYLDLSEVDIAEYLAVPRGTVKSRLHDARKRLRMLLARDVAPHPSELED
jgi:RNA polymerase sigma-70 factor (ECF subfamily)